MKKIHPELLAASKAANNAISSMVDGRLYDANGLRVSFKTNDMSAYYNVSFVALFNADGKQGWRANVRVYDDRGGNFIEHIGLFDTEEEAAWVANAFEANRDENLRRWKAMNGCASHKFPIELLGERPKLKASLLMPDSCLANQMRILTARKAEHAAKEGLRIKKAMARTVKRNMMKPNRLGNTYNITISANNGTMNIGV